MARIAFLISGRGSNLTAILKQIKKKKLKAKPVLVFSDKPDAKGLAKAASFGVKTQTFSPKEFENFTEYERALVSMLDDYKVDYIVCAGYMRILRETMLRAFKGRVLNIHPSLLPSFPGLRAQQQALNYGVQYTGCTVHFVDEGVDTGPIILQAVVPIKKKDTEEALAKRLIKVEHDTYWRALKLVVEGKAKYRERANP